MKEYIDYNQGDGELRNWIVAETDFNSKYQGKFESIFCQGNGYLGTRSATEESYYGQVMARSGVFMLREHLTNAIQMR